ncbi:MAG: protein-L-isoaspartate(D-aspartate) O-methyltransferase [Pseudomonadota bacterium]|jgi:protein-L-isoaspartate(D-aspartate) O-methyltransferase|uniref:protein-L-isoaspartate(D-aspartate) O-methyltransferase n=1 Tax=Burkholderiaceae TaxID=119060 RepID=UPI0010F5C1C3|nr:protein-L-isoaspartate(D-aspartate) O-methyltransferase [Burkholderia sp. 4M9327F10]
MTNERAKRFPLGLEDLVREPRRPEGRPGEVRAANLAAAAEPRAGGGRGKTAVRGDATANRSTARAPAKAAAPVVAKPAVKVTSNLATKPAANLTTKPATKPSGSSVSKTAAALAASSPVSRPAPKPLAARPSVKPARPAERSSAPNVPLNGALALTSERVRERMVERLRANGITDQRVVHAMSVVPRHMFVDPGLATQAYEDAALPIGHHQTISKPSVVARMIELAAAGRTLTNVLEIGTGCGYQAAVLSQVARDVYSIERIKPLYERAKTNLRPLRIPNIRLHYGDGRIGLPAAAPFDAIVIAAAGLDVPQALLEQLAIGGRLVAPVGTQDGQTQQVLTLVERTGPAQWRESRLDRVFFVPLKSGVI